MALVANIGAGKKTDGTTWRPDDFFPSLKPTQVTPRKLPARARAAPAPDKKLDPIAAGWTSWADQAREVARKRGMEVQD